MILTDDQPTDDQPNSVIEQMATIQHGIDMTRAQLESIRAERDRKTRQQRARYVFDRTGQVVRTLQRTAALPELPANQRRVFEHGIAELTAQREEARRLI